MSGWTPDELDAVDRADEVAVTSRRADGTLRGYVTIWAVRVGDDVYVRSAYGPENGWFRRARESAAGRIRGDGFERDVAFETPSPTIDADLDAAYHAKYDRHGRAMVATVVLPRAARSTLRLIPR